MVMCNLLTIGDDILILLLLLVMIGIILTNIIIRHLHRSQLATLIDYFESKSEKAKKFAEKEEDENKKMTYLALQGAWEKAKEVTEKRL